VYVDEQHIDKIIKHKELEGQLFEAKLSQITLQLSEEKERNLQEKQMVQYSCNVSLIFHFCVFIFE